MAFLLRLTAAITATIAALTVSTNDSNWGSSNKDLIPPLMVVVSVQTRSASLRSKAALTRGHLVTCSRCSALCAVFHCTRTQLQTSCECVLRGTEQMGRGNTSPCPAVPFSIKNLFYGLACSCMVLLRSAQGYHARRGLLYTGGSFYCLFYTRNLPKTS